MVELVDVFPTLSDLVGLPSPLGGEIKPREGGSSFYSSFQPNASTMGGLSRPPKQYAFSQYPRCGGNTTQPPDLNANGDCLKVPAANFTTMGFSIRDASFRYTEWKAWNGATLQPRWEATVAAELYDHRGDDGLDFDAFENENIVNITALQQDVARLSSALQKHFSADGAP
jgi:hypothetical protein